MNAVLYARVSTDKQADLSIPAQLEAMRAYAKQKQWLVAEEFIEPGASAKTAERPALQRLLSRIRDSESQTDVVLVHKIDRLARNVYDHATIKALLTQRQVQLASVVENVDDTVPGQLVENIMASIAQFYSANLAQEVKKGMRQKIITGGWPHLPPRGYVAVRTGDGRKTTVQIHPREGPVMRRAFELYATGAYSIKALARRLAADGVTARSGRPIAISYLRRMLINPFYAGRLKWGDLDVPGAHKALVSMAVFQQVQAAIEKRYRNPGVKGSVEGFPLRGVSVCAMCRGRMTAERHGRWGYYRCGRNAFKSSACRGRFCNATRAHSDLERICQQLRLTRPVVEAIMKAATRLIHERMKVGPRSQQALEQQQADLLREEMSLTKAFAANDMPSHVYSRNIENLRAKRAALEHQREGLTADPEQLATRITHTLQVATSMWDLYESLSERKRTELVRQVFDTIVMSNAGISGFTLTKPYEHLVSAKTSESGLMTEEDASLIAQSVMDAA